MLKRLSLLPLLTLCGLLGTTLPARSQALTPYVLPLDYDLMTEQGLFLANEAQQLAEFQQFGRALALAQLAAQLAPNDGQVLALLGGLYLQNSEVDKALPLLEQARTLLPDNARVLFALGSAYLQQENHQLAASYLEQGLQIEPNNPSALFDLGNTYFKLGQYPQAIARFEQSVAAEPEFWPSVNNIGLVLYEQGDTQRAVEYWRSSLELAANEPEPKLAIAAALNAQENCAVAVVRASSAACQEALRLGTEALEQDSRYADVDFLKTNLWGDRLIDSTTAFFEVPDIKTLLSEL
ncbi:tetratricopeptide repeat protein [Leptolyngbya sp. CCNP1308]|uniref:tetratricopeptide repeat protein n=1 Tax=Leptolyngbya sp. CCNP1308 TaxID=3110255 RepID=UPI002B20C9C9|nr:tetratricopeptide repeat protein [Leptolyngbya sp. CCNP1308]MEA5452615.1 tetratricopeptide repeat protein [Leptolyngbya sp. CCNP1308]